MKKKELIPVLVPKRRVNCPRCSSDKVRVSEGQSLGEWLGELVGFRPLRCERCMIRFSAFAPVVRTIESKPRSKQPAAFTLPARRTPSVPAATPLEEIRAIEDEWRQRVQPGGLVEETLCAQLAHATWHLRSLHRAERESIAAAARNRSFNGEAAVSLMTWRKSAESAIQSALDQLESYRRLNPGSSHLAPAGDLLALANGIGPAHDTFADLYQPLRRSPE